MSSTKSCTDVGCQLSDRYSTDLEQRLNHAVWSLDFVTPSDVPDIEVAEPKAGLILNPYVYFISHRLPWQRFVEMQRQTKLI